MCALLAGRAAESVGLHSVSTGAHDDLQRVTSIAYQIVAKFGMSDKACLVERAVPVTTPQVGSINVHVPQPDEGRRAFSNSLAELIDAEVRLAVITRSL